MSLMLEKLLNENPGICSSHSTQKIRRQIKTEAHKPQSLDSRRKKPKYSNLHSIDEKSKQNVYNNNKTHRRTNTQISLISPNLISPSNKFLTQTTSPERSPRKTQNQFNLSQSKQFFEISPIKTKKPNILDSNFQMKKAVSDALFTHASFALTNKQQSDPQNLNLPRISSPKQVEALEKTCISYNTNVQNVDYDTARNVFLEKSARNDHQMNKINHKLRMDTRINNEKQYYWDNVSLLDKTHCNKIGSTKLSNTNNSISIISDKYIEHLHNSEIPYIQLVEMMPKCINFCQNYKKAYIEIQASLKHFPLYLSCNRDDLDLEYYISFNKSKLPTKNFYDHKASGSEIIIDGPSWELNVISAIFQPAKSRIMPKGSVSHGAKQKQCNEVVVLICCDNNLKKKIPLVFSYNFYNPRFEHKRERIVVPDYYSDRGKKILYEKPIFFEGNLKQVVQDSAEKIRQKKNEDPNDIMYKNKQIATFYNKHRVFKIANQYSESKTRSKQTLEKNRQIFRNKMKSKEADQQKHDLLKEKLAKDKELACHNEQKMRKDHSWLSVLNFFGKMNQIQEYFKVEGPKKVFQKIQIMKARQIQKTFRNIRQSKNIKKNIYNDVIFAKNCLQIYCKTFKLDVRARSILLQADFIEGVLAPMAIQQKTQNFILFIKNVQVRWKKHLQLKKCIVGEQENSQQKEILNLAEFLETKKNQDISLNLLSSDRIKQLFEHMFDRQIQYYIQVRYAYLMHRRNEQLEKKAKAIASNLGKNPALRSILNLPEMIGQKRQKIMPVNKKEVDMPKLKIMCKQMSGLYEEVQVPVEVKNLEVELNVDDWIRRKSHRMGSIAGNVLKEKPKGRQKEILNKIKVILDKKTDDDYVVNSMVNFNDDYDKDDPYQSIPTDSRKVSTRTLKILDVEPEVVQSKDFDKKNEKNELNEKNEKNEKSEKSSKSSNSSNSSNSSSSPQPMRKSKITTVKVETIKSSKKILTNKKPVMKQLLLQTPQKLLKRRSKIIVPTKKQEPKPTEDEQEKIFDKPRDSKFKKKSVRNSLYSPTKDYPKPTIRIHDALCIRNVFNISESELNPAISIKLRNKKIRDLEKLYKIDRKAQLEKDHQYDTNRQWIELTNLNIYDFYNQIITRVPEIYDKIFNLNKNIKKKRGSIPIMTRDFLDKQIIESYGVEAESRVDFDEAVNDDGVIINDRKLNFSIMGTVGVGRFQLKVKSKVMRALIVSMLEVLSGKKIVF